MNDLQHKGWKVPYVFGTDDVPYELMDWKATGGSTFKRRWGDINSAAKGAAAYEEFIEQLPKMRDMDTILKAMDNIYQNLRGHDEGVTREVMFRTVEGITKFFKKDYASRLPFGAGTFIGAVSGRASYAQAALGREQMAWDETDSYTFVHKARAMNLITKDQMLLLEKSTGSRSIQVGGDIARTLGPLLLIGFALYMFGKVNEEK